MTETNSASRTPDVAPPAKPAGPGNLTLVTAFTLTTFLSALLLFRHGDLRQRTLPPQNATNSATNGGF